ncbi:DUF6438 domain-containing protein [Ferruginibacter sp. SUN106]|uniref:DUF6438 domain-containing protein n=1 Tax=Ferruginibacter sp. SUN106 TaxID=2978348 RepID=UPI003D368B68
MKLLLVIIAGIFFNASCINRSSPDYRTLIQGDWQSKKSDSFASPKPYTFSFEDSLYSIINPYFKFSKYNITGDIISIQIDSLEVETRYPLKYKIVLLNADSLILHPISTDTILTKTFRLGKIKPKNNLSPVMIYFQSSPCFGSCPSVTLEIDSVGKLLFYGGNLPDTGLIFKDSLNKKKFDLIVDKIRNLAIDSLNEFYDAGWTDDQSCGVNIVTKDRQIHSTAYGYDKEPVELRLLLNYLMYLNKRLHLQPATGVNEDYFEWNKNLQLLDHTAPPPMVAPPPIKNKHKIKAGRYKH